MGDWLIILICGAVAFVVAACVGSVLIPYLRKKCFGQTILDIGPRWHKSKQGTPIMGGFMFIIGSITAAVLGYAIYKNGQLDLVTVTEFSPGLVLLACIIFAALFSGIGFADDYIKAVKKQNLGLKAKQKMLFQFVLSASFLAALYAFGMKSTEIDLVFWSFDAGIFYYPIMILLTVFISNAVNLTDGVDGLCGTVTFVSMMVLTAVLSYLGHKEVSFYAAAIGGGCLGFLVWNLHPAKCFMGDTGSMYLGGAFAAFSIVTGKHLLMALVGLVYVCEALSVILQVISFKTTGKRIFKMSPIHHHFEMIGYSEYKIVITFSIVGLIAGIGALAILIASN